MRDLSQSIRFLRQNLGLSQSALAQAAGVSLPSIQKLEAGKANPSLDTLGRITRVLGLSIEFRLRPVDWNLLAAYGAPLLIKGTLPPRKRHKTQLTLLLKQACIELSMNANSSDRERKREALAALLLAIQSHYGPFYRELSKSSPIVQQFLDSIDLSGRLIKMKRQALACISEVL